MQKPKRFLGIDIGGQAVKWGLVEKTGTLVRQGKEETKVERGLECFLQTLENIVAKNSTEHIAGIGVCAPGAINPEEGTILALIENIPFLYGFGLRKELETRFGMPVRVVNDAKAAAMGEMWTGAARELDNFFMLTLGTGLGGCLVIDGKVHTGSNYSAGELGYYDYLGPDNYFEKFFSTSGFFEVAAKGLGLSSLDGLTFFRRVREGDEVYRKLLEEWMAGLARKLANIVLLLDPQKILVGGGISAQGELFLPVLRNYMEQMLPPDYRGKTPVEVTKHRNSAGILGAVAQFADDM